MHTPSPPMNPEVARLRRQGAQRRYLKGLRYVRGLWAVAGLLLLVLVGEVLLALSVSPRFWIHRLRVSGVETLTPVEVIRLAQVPEGSNYYRISLHEVAARVCTEPRVQRVTVRRQRVGTLEIAVRERQAVCRLGTTRPLTYLDAAGHLFTRPVPPTQPVPVVEQLEIPAGSVPGQRLHSEAAHVVLECLAAARDVPETAQAPEIARVFVAPQGRLTLVLRQGTKLFMGRPVDFARKMWVVRHTIAEAAKNGLSPAQLEYIDVKVVDRPTGIGAYYKPRDQQEVHTP